jgi:hypothetical protein
MKYESEFQEELYLCLNNSGVMGKYSANEVYDILLEYWNKKDVIISEPLFTDEFYKNVNDELFEFKKLTAKQKKTYLQMKIKSLKFKKIL